MPGIPTAGKSGTAELGGDAAPHSWFIGFAPVDAPQIAVAVIVEGGGAGAQRAVPMAGDLMTYYLTGELTRALSDTSGLERSENGAPDVLFVGRPIRGRGVVSADAAIARGPDG